MDEGAFEDLPHQGERLPLEDDSAAGDWAMAHRMLGTRAWRLPWIEADKRVRALLDERDRLLECAGGLGPLGRTRARDELRRVVDAANRAIVGVNSEAPTDRQQRRLIDLDVEHARFDRAVQGDPEVDDPRR